MRKVKRRLGRSPSRKCEKRDLNINKPAVTPEEEQVFPPPGRGAADEFITAYTRQNPFSSSKSHRCTYYRPSNEDFGQLTDVVLPPREYYQNLLQEICDPNPPDTTKPKEKKINNTCQGSTIRTSSPTPSVKPASRPAVNENMIVDLFADAAQWQMVDSVSEVDKFLSGTPETEKESVKSEKKSLPSLPNVFISETPRVKRIAEKYSKFKRNNIELRKLEERIVCLEYDIFDLNSDDPTVPTQKMRAFFSIKTKNNEVDDKDNINCIPSNVKRNFNIEDGDLQKLNRKEIEIIDDKINENRSILEDLKCVLRRKQALENKKKQQTLDLMYLYEMAKRESPPIDHDYSKTNLLSKAELQEIKDLILRKCASSSVHGINRRTVKCTEGEAIGDADCVISDSLISELLRDGKKV